MKYKINKFSFILIILVIVFIGSFIWGLILINKSTENQKMLLISLISGEIIYIGTTVLGMITYWQTLLSKDTNNRLIDFQEKEWLNKQQTFIEFLPEFSVKLKKFDYQAILKAQKCEVNALFVSSVPLEEIGKGHQEKKFILFEFQFKTSGMKLKQISCSNFCLNELEKDGDDWQKTLFRCYQVMQWNRKKVACEYNPVLNSYILSLYIYETDALIKDANDREMLIFDIDLISESVYGIKTKQKFGFNFVKIDWNFDLNGFNGKLNHVDLYECEIQKENSNE